MKNKQNEYKNRITDTNHITMTPFLSQKIKLLSLISIILVLYIHSGFHDYPNEKYRECHLISSYKISLVEK